jgi:hypothetical protein
MAISPSAKSDALGTAPLVEERFKTIFVAIFPAYLDYFIHLTLYRVFMYT